MLSLLIFSMESDLGKRIYKAQCIGNVEPIEHMVPYPNLRALIDGQNIKYGKKMVYADLKLTSDKVYRLAQQTANWLASNDIKPKDRVLVDKLSFPQCEVLAFGIWTLGASMVLTGDKDIEGAKKSINPSMIITSQTDYFKDIGVHSEIHEPTYKPLLADEAIIFWDKGKGIRLSHYNLLVNANGIQHAIDLFEDQTFYVNLEPNSLPWVILQTILPLYTGAPLTSDNPNLRLGNNKDDFQIRWNWDALQETEPPSLYICNENSGFLAINKRPMHLTAINDNVNPSLISGHSVMMGYTSDSLNEKVFRQNCLMIKDFNSLK